MKSKRLSMMRAILSLILIVSLIPLSTLTSRAADGDLDLGFDGDGKVITDFATGDDVGNAMALQNDGKIVVVGVSDVAFSTRDFAVARYNTDGSPDSTFDGDGKVTTTISGLDTAFAVAIQTDGKIVAAGLAGGPVANPTADFALVRYNSNGSLDTSFDGDGKVITPFETSPTVTSDTLSDIVIQPDGKIVAAGTTRSGSSPSIVSDFALARYNPNGSLDTNFDGDGKVVTDLYGGIDEAHALVLENDGKVIAVGLTHGNTIPTLRTGFGLARYNSDGSLDTTYDGDGKVHTLFVVNTGSATGQALAAVIQSDGRVVATGLVQDAGDNRFGVARYNTNGSLDTSFSDDGIAFINFNSTGETPFAIALQNDGKVVLAGTNSNNNGDFLLVRFTASGVLDTTFDNDGFVFTALGTADDVAFALAIQGDGKIVAAGRSNNAPSSSPSDFALVRYQSSGAALNRPPLFDFDGDGLTDISVFRPSDGTWYLQRSSLGFTAIPFGISTDRIVPADYDGDDKTDVAVFRDGTWYLLQSTVGFASILFGQTGDVPAPGDFDGDGKADVAVFRPSNGTWFLLQSTAGISASQFGTSGDVPVICDFDGDGKSDITVFRQNEGAWYSLLSSNGSFSRTQFGISGDLPVAADYDGDRKTDIAVYRPSDGVWYLLRSLSGLTAIRFGNSTDRPTPGDYDGDGMADVAVFRNGFWYQLRSGSGVNAVQFGQSSDVATPSAYVP